MPVGVGCELIAIIMHKTGPFTNSGVSKFAIGSRLLLAMRQLGPGLVTNIPKELPQYWGLFTDPRRGGPGLTCEAGLVRRSGMI